jgi:DNA polymerase-3 subunit delta'
MPKIDGVALHGLADRIAKGGGEGPFRLASELLLEKVARSLRAGAGRHDASAGDADGLSRLVRPANLDQWLDLWEKISRLFAKTESTNLDRKQVWIGAMLEIGGLAGR